MTRSSTSRIEPEAVSGLDLERHASHFLPVEMLEPERTRSRIEELISARYEALEQLSPHDHLFRLRQSL